ncbi:MAG: hypothetical protein ACK4VV_07395 [Pseudomonas sp.]
MQKSLLILGLLLLPLMAQAQNSVQVSDDPMQIVGDPGIEPRERIDRSIALLMSLADVEEQRGDLDMAGLLRTGASILQQAPANREASQLAADAVMAAEQGNIQDALILAEAAAALSPGWMPPQAK